MDSWDGVMVLQRVIPNLWQRSVGHKDACASWTTEMFHYLKSQVQTRGTSHCHTETTWRVTSIDIYASVVWSFVQRFEFYLINTLRCLIFWSYSHNPFNSKCIYCKEELDALMNLSSEKDLIITKPDKENGVAVVNRKCYFLKMSGVLRVVPKFVSVRRHFTSHFRISG